MVPPEVILDRWVRERQRRHETGFSGYLGRLDIEGVESLSFRSLLRLIKDTTNEALRLAGPNASCGVEHPPFHFDYIDASSEITNAHAFEHEDFSFIVVTLPMVELIFELSRRLSRPPRVLHLLHLDSGAIDSDALQGLLFQLQLNFLVSHEYTHHIHRHCAEGHSDVIGVWSEFLHGATCGGIHSQAQELDADGYAVFLVLAHLLRGERRDSALQQLGSANMPGTNGDELLLTFFFLAVLAYFCSFWYGGLEMASLYQSTHPPPPVRIKYAIQVAEMWCGLNGSVSKSWFAPTRFQPLFRVAADVIGAAARRTWDAQISFLRSADGAEYDLRLFEEFEAVRQAMRQKGNEQAQMASGVEHMA